MCQLLKTRELFSSDQKFKQPDILAGQLFQIILSPAIYCILRHILVIEINECDSNPCDQICTDGIGTFQCSCRAGFTLHGARTCNDTNECLTDNVDCGLNANCVNTPGSYKCVCKSGYLEDNIIATDGTESFACVCKLLLFILFIIIKL